MEPKESKCSWWTRHVCSEVIVNIPPDSFLGVTFFMPPGLLAGPASHIEQCMQEKAAAVTAIGRLAWHGRPPFLDQILGKARTDFARDSKVIAKTTDRRRAMTAYLDNTR